MSQNLSIAQNKVEVSSKNNTASNHSSDYVVSAQKKKECSEKGSDVQVSFISSCSGGCKAFLLLQSLYCFWHKEHYFF